ncbi:MAG: DUF2793 domain-containing protein, partial [Blastochloris sp.]|nr:DUF2793 domain-containing protein [Blastochloris sp.]
MSTPHITAPYLVEGQSQGEVTHNDGLNYLETLICGKIKDRNLTAPPGSPADGDAYIVMATATGAWAGHDGKIAAYYSGWIFITPKESFRVYIE